MEMSNNISLNVSNQLLETPPLNSYHSKYLQQKTQPKKSAKNKKIFFSRAIQGSTKLRKFSNLIF
jgi:hypothetical protein